MKIQLEKSLIKTKYTENLDLTWALKNIKPIINQHIDGEYIAIFPFSSEKHKNKIWPYFSDLIKEIKSIFGEKYNIVIAPAPNEIYSFGAVGSFMWVYVESSFLQLAQSRINPAQKLQILHKNYRSCTKDPCAWSAALEDGQQG